MTQEDIISDEEIKITFGNANFGDISNREVVNFALLKVACGYLNGHTAQCIIRELGLVGNSLRKSQSLTKKGKEYLWIAFSKNSKL